MSSHDAACLLVVRLRGPSGLSAAINNTLEMLNLKRSCWATIIPNTSSMVGMLKKVERYVTWGDPNEQLLTLLINTKGEAMHGVNIEEELKSLGASSIEELVKLIVEGKCESKVLWRFYKPYFRLHPPKGGFKRSTKRPFKEGGEYGYRGVEISELVKRMI